MVTADEFNVFYSRAVKIVLTIHHFLPRYTAGAELYTFRLAGWLLKHGYDVEVVCVESVTWGPTSEVDSIHDVYEGLSVWRLRVQIGNTQKPFRQSYCNSHIGRWFTDFLERVRPDLVHVNSCYLLSISPLAVAEQLSLPVVLTLHDFWFLCPLITLLKPTGDLCTVPKDPAECAWCLATQKRRFRLPDKFTFGGVRRLGRYLLSSTATARLLGVDTNRDDIAARRSTLLAALDEVDLIIAPSAFLRNTFLRHGTKPEKIVYSRYGLDTAHWAAPRDSESVPSRDLRIAYIGQISPHKGVHLLIRAFNKLDLSRRAAHLTIWGDTGVFPAYAALLDKLARKSPNITFAGRFDNREIAKILQNIDLTVAPSVWYENSPIAIMESLTAGTPVVTANLGGMPELVQHNLQGLLFKPGDVKDLAIQLQRLVDEPHLAAELASRALPARTIDDEMSYLTTLYERVYAKVR